MPGLGQIETSSLPKKGKVHKSQILTRALNKVIGYTSRPSRPKFFYPSALKLECKKALWYHYWGVDSKGNPLPLQEIDPLLARVFSTGNSFEDRFIKYLKSAKLYLADEKSFLVNSPIPVSGRIDFVINFKKKIWVVELKTINSKGFDKLKAPKPEHIMQVQCYLNNTEYEEAFIVYENKDNQAWKEYRLERDPDLWGKMVEMCQAVMSEEVLPEDWKCTGPPWCVCKGVDQ